MSEPGLDRVIETCREPVAPRPGFERRVRDAVRAESRTRTGGGWLAVGLAAVLLLSAVGLGILGHPFGARGATLAVRFEVEAPQARTVTLVGDFNDWDRSRTALLRRGAGQRWSVTLSLPDGVYRYAFLVDGTSWIADPSRPEVADPDFGTPLSVVAIGEPRS